MVIVFFYMYVAFPLKNFFGKIISELKLDNFWKSRNF